MRNKFLRDEISDKEIKSSWEKLKPSESAKNRMLDNILTSVNADRKEEFGMNISKFFRTAIPVFGCVAVIGAVVLFQMELKNLPGTDMASETDYTEDFETTEDLFETDETEESFDDETDPLSPDNGITYYADVVNAEEIYDIKKLSLPEDYYVWAMIDENTLLVSDADRDAFERTFYLYGINTGETYFLFEDNDLNVMDYKSHSDKYIAFTAYKNINAYNDPNQFMAVDYLLIIEPQTRKIYTFDMPNPEEMIYSSTGGVFIGDMYYFDSYYKDGEGNNHKDLGIVQKCDIQAGKISLVKENASNPVMYNGKLYSFVAGAGEGAGKQSTLGYEKFFKPLLEASTNENTIEFADPKYRPTASGNNLAWNVGILEKHSVDGQCVALCYETLAEGGVLTNQADLKGNLLASSEYDRLWFKFHGDLLEIRAYGGQFNPGLRMYDVNKNIIANFDNITQNANHRTFYTNTGENCGLIWLCEWDSHDSNGLPVYSVNEHYYFKAK